MGEQQVQQTTEAANQAAAAASDVVTDPTIFNRLAEFFHAGGPLMWLILFIMAWAVVVAVDRIYRIYLVYSVNGESFFAKIEKYILDNSIDRAMNLCNGKSGALLPNVMKAGLMRAHGTETEIKSAVEEATLEALPLIEKRSMFLPLISNISTLVGLLGTIQGLIAAFSSLGAAAPEERSAALAAAIAEAMSATAFGLLVAIPSMIFHTIIQSRANHVIGEIDQYGVRLVNLLLQAKKK